MKSETTTKVATQARLNIIRMLEATPAGHVGGAMSCLDAVAVIYNEFMNISPSEPHAPGRDRFILSAGHKAMAQYAILAQQGFFPEDLLDTYGKPTTRLGGHPDMAKVPGIEANTGALGHGLALGVGMALGLADNYPEARTYVVMGDGELAEGSNWEAAAMAAHFGIDALTVLIDKNGLQISGTTKEVLDPDDIGAKFSAFGWGVASIDGHDVDAIRKALNDAHSAAGPQAIILNTIKGRGIAEIEGQVASHYWKPDPTQLQKARAHLSSALAE